MSVCEGKITAGEKAAEDLATATKEQIEALKTELTMNCTTEVKKLTEAKNKEIAVCEEKIEGGKKAVKVVAKAVAEQIKALNVECT